MPRKLEPGLEAMNSKFSVLITSTMKSPPGRSVVRTSTLPAGSASRGATGALAWAAGAAWGLSLAAVAARAPSAAALVTAAVFRKSRRSTECFSDIAASGAATVYCIARRGGSSDPPGFLQTRRKLWKERGGDALGHSDPGPGVNPDAHDANRTDGNRRAEQTGHWHRLTAHWRFDVHAPRHEQVVIERDDGQDRTEEDQAIHAALSGGEKDIQLGPETGDERNAAEG